MSSIADRQTIDDGGDDDDEDEDQTWWLRRWLAFYQVHAEGRDVYPPSDGDRTAGRRAHLRTQQRQSGRHLIVRLSGLLATPLEVKLVCVGIKCATCAY
jgi:hypothetical protein